MGHSPLERIHCDRLVGVLQNERFPAVLPAVDGSRLTGIAGGSTTDASLLTSGILALARLSGITHAQLDAAAGILYSQLVLTGSIVNADVAAGAAIAYAKLSLAGAVVNADINAAAAIAWSKLSKAGSSLADLATRSASDLSSGLLDPARFFTSVDISTTGSVNDLNFAGASLIRMTNASLATITGLLAGASGQLVAIYATSAQFNIADQSASSSAIDRIITGNGNTHAYQGTGGTTSDPLGFALLQYDGVAQRWRVIAERTIRFRSFAFLNTSGHSIPNNTTTLVPLDAEDYDVGGFHDNVTNNTRLVVPVGGAGSYLVDFHVGFLSTLNARYLLALNKNGAQIAIGFDLQAAPASGVMEINASAFVMDMIEGDYLEATAYQNTGGGVTLDWGARYTNHLNMVKVA